MIVLPYVIGVREQSKMVLTSLDISGGQPRGKVYLEFVAWN